jgi:ubiquinone/menaquinone biosynthesis C-methylase UbiE
MIENRKQEEIDLQNKIRNNELKENTEDYQRLTSNRKFYSIVRKSIKFLNDYLFKKYKGKKVLDYGCGDGDVAVFLAKNGIEMVGIDIADIRIKKARQLAQKEGMNSEVAFFVMDAEKTEFPNNYFDGIICTGVLHHLEIEKAFKEMARILKPEGTIICNEPLAYNPIFQLYRKLTPHLRSEWEKEHILSKKDIKLAEKYFGKVEKRFFYLTSLLAVPFRNLPVFNFILSILEGIDSIILKLPFIKWWAWQIIFILSKPINRRK